jgi:cell division protein FtsW
MPEQAQREEKVRAHRPDYWLLVLMAILLAIGAVVVYSISPALGQASGVGGSFFAERQLLAFFIGAVGFFIAARLPMDFWKRMTKPLLIVAALMTLVALAMPVNVHYPAHRWVRLGGLSFQTVELLKLAMVVWLAKLFSSKMRKHESSDKKNMLWPLIAIVVGIGLVVAGLQSDLGSAGVLILMLGVMAFVAGMPLKRILAVGGLVILVGVLAVAVTPYRRHRITAFLGSQQSNCQTASGYQSCQAMIAVGSGGMFGMGLGRSVQAYGYLPEAANDSIFAIYAEKFGFFGVVILLALYAALFSRLKRIAAHAPDNFSRLLMVGILTWISLQTIINIAAMLGLMPLKGITLPFVSYGGTSVLFLMVAMGLVFQVSRHTTYAKIQVNEQNSRRAGDYANHPDGRRVRGAYHPDLGRRQRVEKARSV